MINATAWNWGGLSGFFWGSFPIFAAIWCFFYLPEFKDRSARELDILFETGVKARDFSTTVVDANKEAEMEAKGHH